MTGDDSKTADLLSVALRETLDTLVDPSVRSSLVREALRASGLSLLPETPLEVWRFVDGPLRAAISRSFGPDLASSVAAELGRLVNTATRSTPPGGLHVPVTPNPSDDVQPVPPSSGFTRRSPVPQQLRKNDTPYQFPLHSTLRPQLQAPPVISAKEYARRVTADSEQAFLEAPTVPYVARSRVLAATVDSALLRALTGWLGEHAQLSLVRSVFAVLRHLDESPCTPIYLMLDAAHPGIRPAALAALAEDLGSIAVIVCRSTPEFDAELRAVSPLTNGWLRLSEEAEVEDIAARCLELVS